MEPKLLTTGTAPTLQKKFRLYRLCNTHKNRFAAASTVIPISIFIRSDGTVCPPPHSTKENAKEILQAGDTFELEPMKDEAAMFMAKGKILKYVHPAPAYFFLLDLAF